MEGIAKAIPGAKFVSIAGAGHMVMLDALRSHWEATGDKRILALCREFFRFCASIPEESFVPALGPGWKDWKPGIQTTRSGDMLPHIYWLYNVTGDDWLLPLATRFHDHVQPPESKWLNHHVVHFTQRFREPGNYYAQSGDPGHLRETEHWYDMHMAEWGQQPGGIFGADAVTVNPYLGADALRRARALDDGDGVLVLTDLYGSTPSNIAASLLGTGAVQVVAGLNLPMLIRVLNYPAEDLPALADKAVSGGNRGILLCRGGSPDAA